MSRPAVLDGRARFRCSLTEFYGQPIIVSDAARRGILIPPVAEVATDAAPAMAFVDVLDGIPRWLASCPVCPFARDVSYVWLEGPHVAFFLQCGNRDAGGMWRPVLLPRDYRAIEKALEVRPPEHRNWRPWETLAQLRAENTGMDWRA